MINITNIRNQFISFLISVGLFGLIKLASAQVTLPNPLSVTSFTAVICNVAVYIAGLVGSLAVIMLVWAGILYLTSGMNPGNAQKANKAVIYAVIGLAVALAGGGLVLLVSNIIGGSGVTVC